MDPATISAIASGLGGVAGLFGLGAPKKSAAQKQQEALANELLGLQVGSYKDALALARGYDPVAEAQGTVRLAEEQAANTLEQSMRNLNARFKTSGGNAGQDSYFNASTQAIARDVSNPLKALLAEAQSNATLKKINALMGGVGAGGSVIGSALSLMDAGKSQPRDLSGSLAMLSQGVGGLLHNNTQAPVTTNGVSTSNGVKYNKSKKNKS